MKTRESSSQLGFTLIEILVVVALIGLLATAVGFGISNSAANSRDAKRQADLKNLQQAIETYKNREGRYPEQCVVGGVASGGSFWSGQVGTDYECDDGSGQYIVGLAPEYISVLPIDPRLPDRTDTGYVYRTNAAGTVYKIMALNSVEADPVLNSTIVNEAYMHPLKSCDMVGRDNGNNTYAFVSGRSYCHRTDLDDNGSFEVPSHCTLNNTRFKTSYGLWGGFAPLNGTLTFPFTTDTHRSVVKQTANVICR
jgi:prepilin-type N-terminal cleavage/methylation domain-containing protein